MELGLTVGDDPDRITAMPAGFDFVEVGIGDAVSIPAGRDPTGLLDRAESVGCSMSVHLPFKQELATPIPEVNDAIVAYLDRLLEWAGSVRARYAVVHATARNPGDTTLRETAVEQLRSVATAAEEREITLVVENVGHQPKGFPLSVVADLTETAAVPLCFDLGHAYMEDGNDAIERTLSRHAARIGYLHVHDVRSRGDTHLPLGAGEVDFELLTDHWPLLDVPLALEIFADDRALLTDSADRIRELLDGDADPA